MSFTKKNLGITFNDNYIQYWKIPINFDPRWFILGFFKGFFKIILKSYYVYSCLYYLVVYSSLTGVKVDFNWILMDFYWTDWTCLDYYIP